MATELAPPMADTLAASGGENAGEFAELEAKIERVAILLRDARAERDRALATLGPLQSAHERLQASHAQSEAELVTLRKERNEVRQRVTRLLKQLEAAAS